MHRPLPRHSARDACLLAAAAWLAALAAVSVPGAAAAPAPSAPPAAAALADTVRLHVMPMPAVADAGDTVLVELTVPIEGPAFNAYDAYLTYDPAVLRFLPAANIATQEGPLMTTGCGLRFHVFDADTLAGRLRISHSLLCAGQSRTGPGVVYRVRFQCRDVDAVTPLTLLLTAPYKTLFYNAGLFVTPLATVDSVVRVGTPWVAPATPPAAGNLADLRAMPNPFNPRTTISFSAASAGDAAVTVYAVDGRLVRRLWDGRLDAGPWSGMWDGRDDDGRAVAAGIYLVRVRVAGAAAATRVALVR